MGGGAKKSAAFSGAERILFPDEPLTVRQPAKPVPVEMDFEFLPEQSAGGARRRTPAGVPTEAVPVDRALEFVLQPPAGTSQRRARNSFLSLIAHVLLVGVGLLIPLYYTESLELRQLQQTWLAAPPPPPPPPPPPAAQRPAPTRPRLVRAALEAKVTLPTTIPKEIAQVDDIAEVEMAALGVAGGVPGGVPGGQMGGVLGGVLGGVPSVAPPPVATKPRGPLRVGGEVRRPRLVKRVQPRYPPVARQARIQGEVRIRAIIDTNGRVVQMEVLSGHPLLAQAATNAVQQWIYEPTYLNGEPVPLEFVVTVSFNLG